jgi:hypothetical protein
VSWHVDEGYCDDYFRKRVITNINLPDTEPDKLSSELDLTSRYWIDLYDDPRLFQSDNTNRICTSLIRISSHHRGANYLS